MEDIEKKEIDDIEEDRREEKESLKDVKKGDKGALNDVEEDIRESGESIEDLKRQIKQLTRERDEANALATSSTVKSGKMDTLAEMLRELLGVK